VVDRVIQKLEKMDPSFYIGRGKLERIKQIVHEFGIATVIFDDELTPSQLKNIEIELKCEILDRTQLILNIFAKNARSSEAKLQIELAQLEYLLPRLRGKGEQLSRLGGGIGTRGPGETKLEADKREVKRKIRILKEKLKKISKQREIRRAKRLKNHVPVVAIVGYTNAGKSTLLKQLSKYENIIVEDKLFSTLSSLTKRVRLKSGKEVLFTDTVGFIKKLPHTIIEAFKSTLEEVKYSDLILIVIDAFDRNYENKLSVVEKVLEEIGSIHQQRILAFNKIELCSNEWLENIKNKYRHSLFISAKKRIGLENLLDAVEEKLLKENTYTEVIKN
jgi:GTP-binding protein HflX